MALNNLKADLYAPVLVFLLVSIFGGCSDDNSSDPYRSWPPVLEGALSAALVNIDSNVAQGAEVLATESFTSSPAHAELSRILSVDSSIIDVAAITADGLMVALEPPSYYWQQGTDISAEKGHQQIASTHEPIMSSVFEAAPRVFGFTLGWPVFRTSGEWAGEVSALVNNAVLVRRAIESQIPPAGVQSMVMQLDGTILYDDDSSQIGRNTFTDPSYAPYTSLLELAHVMVSRPEGEGFYTFASSDGSQHRKQAVWTTVMMHETAWRVAALRDADQ